MAHSDYVPAGSLGRFFYEVREGARRQGNVIFALIFRELKTRSGQEGHGMLSLLAILLEPAAGVAAIAAFWYLLRRLEIQGVNVLLFLTVSMTAFSIVRRSIASVPRTVRASRSFYAFPNVKPFDALIARFTLELLLTTLGGVIMLFLMWWFASLTISMDHFLEGMGILALLIGAAFGTSLFFGVYFTRFPVVAKIVSMASRALLFVSAVMHPAVELPTEAQAVIAWNPIAHALELLRHFLLGTPPFPSASISYVAGWALVSLFLGFISYYVNRRKVIER